MAVVNTGHKGKRDRVYDPGLLSGIAIAIATALVLAITLFSTPVIGAVDFGELYEQLPELGLKHADAVNARSHFYTYVVEEYEWAHFSYMKLFAPSGTPSSAYPIAVIRLLAKPFGILFSTRYLAVCYMLLLSFAMYLVGRYGYRWLRGGIFAPALLVLLLLSDSGLAAYLNSLYGVGMTLCSAFLFAGFLLRAAALRGDRGSLAGMILSGFLLTSSQPELVVLLPLVWMSTCVVAWLGRPSKLYIPVYTLIVAASLLACSYSSAQRFISSRELNSEAATYQSLFSGVFKYAPDPGTAMRELGLDDSYIPDIGRSYYEPEGNYAHNPRDAGEFALIERSAGRGDLARYYAAHPGVMGAMVGELSVHFGDYANQRLLAVGASLGDEDAVTERVPLAKTIRKMIYPKDYRTLVFILALTSIASLAYTAWPRGKERVARAMLSGLPLLLLSLCVLAYLPLRLLCVGDAGIDLAKVTLLFLFDFMLIAVAGIGICCADKLYHYLSGMEMERGAVAQKPIVIFARVRLAVKKKASTVISSKRLVIAIIVAMATLMICCLLLIPSRAGGVNNGDFGRMMRELGLIWESDIYHDPDAQLGKQVIETYAFREPLDALKLTFLKPTYSLIFPATIVRLLCEWAHLPFHTNYLSFIFCAVALACIWSLSRDLYGYFGRLTLPVGLVLCAMLLGEVYVAWFNSLFGESSIYLGVLMLLTVSVRMSVLPRGAGARFMPLLMFACLFLTTAKAQMLLALPGCFALAVVFGVYHMPKELRKRILYSVVAGVTGVIVIVSSVAVYLNNDEISAKHTTWQSVFFGVLVIADDPIKEMEELGIDTAMAPDIGKHAYLSDDQYVYAPLSAEAQAAFYDHVDMFAIINYYLRHPTKLVSMLNHAARQSVTLHDGFMAYVGQRYDQEHDAVDRFGLWQYTRSMFAGRSFWHYLLLYGALIFLCVRRLRDKRAEARKKLLTVVFLAMMLIGVLQYPLSVIGNGFADNNKQLFCFMLCHDILMIFAAFEIGRFAWNWWKKNAAGNAAKKRPAPAARGIDTVG